MNFKEALARFLKGEKLGAEYFGTVPYADFQKRKWTVKGCNDWHIDEEYSSGNTGAAQVEVDSYNQDAPDHKCIDCLWNDGDYCCHEKAQVPKVIAERERLGIF